ncbi:MAG: response regulator [Deltaproteobacteria bacterium]|nr:MAG: response regulator [Deltaproteobacteria bacterium]
MSRTQQLHVLVVDAEETGGSRLAEFLVGEGHDARHIREPTRALDALKHGHCQLLLLDLGKPVDEGVQLLQRIRAADSDLCVVAMTERPTVESAVAAMKLGAFDYLTRPFEFEDLRAVVREAIRRKGLLVDLEQELNATVGARIRERRLERRLTLKQLANRTGLSVSLISQIELGRSAASMSTLHKLATALSVKMTYFFETV